MKGFLIPNGVVDFSVDADGIIHAANPGKHRVERYTPDGRVARAHRPLRRDRSGGLPRLLQSDQRGRRGRDRIYVTEKAGPRAKVYDFEGKLLAVIATDVFDPNCKNMGIAVDARGRVYVADTVRLEILVFEEDARAMSEDITRRDVLGKVVRGSVLLALRRRRRLPGQEGGRTGGLAGGRVEVRQQPARRGGRRGLQPLHDASASSRSPPCGRSTTSPSAGAATSVPPTSTSRARWTRRGLPSEKLCPRDAIARKPIGVVDPEDPANNFYEYIIDEEKCDGCGICVKKCKEPLGLGSIVLKVRYNLCVDCNRCAISIACPKDAIVQQQVTDALEIGEAGRSAVT